ncbi:MAG: hypothetical protein A3H32_16945 [Betaproteobacteria bacterium RIFCSPLOWO2_02_FULL_63_19]|nr:MAG: hypothetical protein A3H32_16945 [Betaproteobacteria bacterium RIFCSPLOWO2_02_FULL_63_19]
MLVRALGSVLLIAVGALTALPDANAAEREFSPQVWINPGIYSLHFDRNKNLRDDNVGLGAEVVLAPDHALLAGSFVNSDWTRSRYGAYAWRPLHWQLDGTHVSAGVIVGAFDGYPRYREGAWFVAPMPVVAIEGERLGVNLSVIPTLQNRVNGAIAVQIKLRVW